MPQLRIERPFAELGHPVPTPSAVSDTEGGVGSSFMNMIVFDTKNLLPVGLQWDRSGQLRGLRWIALTSRCARHAPCFLILRGSDATTQLR
jgi:hypothetical protein